MFFTPGRGEGGGRRGGSGRCRRGRHERQPVAGERVRPGPGGDAALCQTHITGSNTGHDATYSKGK